MTRRCQSCGANLERTILGVVECTACRHAGKFATERRESERQLMLRAMFRAASRSWARATLRREARR